MERGAPIVVGCVAWLTSEPILKALSRVKEGVALVVQKEDFLRPDLGVGHEWKNRLRSQYSLLKTFAIERHQMRGLIGSLSVACDPTIHPVRCVGNHNRDKAPAFPRMHNKFLVFCRPGEIPDEDPDYCPYMVPNPYAVWTGSFNFTKNARMSLENALYLTNPMIVQAYYGEWEQIEAISEPLDWTDEWAAPEWRVGT